MIFIYGSIQCEVRDYQKISENYFFLLTMLKLAQTIIMIYVALTLLSTNASQTIETLFARLLIYLVFDYLFNNNNYRLRD